MQQNGVGAEWLKNRDMPSKNLLTKIIWHRLFTEFYFDLMLSVAFFCLCVCTTWWIVNEPASNCMKNTNNSTQSNSKIVVASIAAASHIVLISLDSTHWRQTTLSVGVAGRLFMIEFLFIHSVFILSFKFLLLLLFGCCQLPIQREKYGKKRAFCNLSKVCWHRNIVGRKKNWYERIWKSIKNTPRSFLNRKHFFVHCHWHFLLQWAVPLTQLIYRNCKAFYQNSDKTIGFKNRVWTKGKNPEELFQKVRIYR